MKALLELISLGSRFYVGGVFIYASYLKVWDPAAFAADMAQYELLPLILVNSASASLAWLELCIGMLLILGLFTRAAALWTSGLLVFFIGLMIYAELSGAGYNCGCFPGESEGSAAGYDTAIRDLIYLIPSLWVMFRPGKWLALERLFKIELVWDKAGLSPASGDG